MYIHNIHKISTENVEKISVTHKTHDMSITAGRPPATTDNHASSYGKQIPASLSLTTVLLGKLVTHPDIRIRKTIFSFACDK